MAWEVVREESPHFVVRGNSGEFKVHQSNLSPGAIEGMRKMCKGGKVAKLADGGVAEDDPAIETIDTPQGGGGSAGVVDADADMAGETAPSAEDLRAAAYAREDARNRAANMSQMHPDPRSLDDQILDKIQMPEAAAARRAAATPASPGVPEMLAAPDPAASTQGPASAAPANEPQSPFPPLPSGADWNKVQSKLDAAQAAGKKGAALQEQAETQQSKDMSTSYQAYVAKLQQLDQQRVTETKAAQARIDQVISDISQSKIDPNHFWSTRSTTEKVATGIGLILGGIGSGLTKQPNMAAQFVERAIDRDVEAQRAEIGKKENLLGFMFKKYGNIQDAAQATRGYLSAVIAGQAGLAAARAGSTTAQANAQLLQSKLAQDAVAPEAQIIQGRHNDAMNQYQMAFQRRLYQSMLSGSTGQPDGYLPSRAPPPIGADPTNPLKFKMEQMKDSADRTLIGPGGKPFLAYTKEVVEKSRPMLQAVQNVDGILKQMDQLRQNSAGVPGTDSANLYHKYRSALAEQWAMANGLTQPSEAMNKNLEEVMPSNWDAFARGKVTFEPILRLLHERARGIYESAGLHPSAQPVLQFPVR